MKVAVLTFDGFNELDSMIAAAMINRAPKLQALLTCPAPQVSSMNGVMMHAQAPLSFAREAEAVIIGSGKNTRDIARDQAILGELRLDPKRQVIGAQCSGTLLLARLGLIGDLPACTDTTTRPWVEEAGVRVVDRPFIAHGNVATAGGCLASHYLAAWVISRLAGREHAEAVLRYVAPAGEKAQYVEKVLGVVYPAATADVERVA